MNQAFIAMASILQEGTLRHQRERRTMMRIAFGCLDSLKLCPEDFFLRVPTRHGQLLLLANAHECGFSTCFPRGSRLFLELFSEAWHEQSFQVDQRPRRALRLSLCQSSRRFLPKTKDWLEDDSFGKISATAAALYITEDRAICSWLGNEHAGVVLDGKVMVENVPDTYAGRLAYLQYPGMPSLQFYVSEQCELEPQLVDWQIPRGSEMILAIKSFPDTLSLQELLPLFELDGRQAAQWCQKNDTGFYCLVKWTSADE